MAHWLFKTEPDVFSVTDLAQRPSQRECWDGVRNYQARNYLRDRVQIDDDVFIYHSSCSTIGIAGLARVSQVGVVDPTQFDPESHYFDPKSMPDNPRWITVEVEWKETFPDILSLSDIKQMPNLDELPLLKKGHRLSIMPVGANEYKTLLTAARR
ncbi:EVE domain-containing protein [Alteromonas oceanisediminis]|uniref:EVE domain-containing protein n=1 Tax=Alteromonas oceanisediminis TaxID=2836180 RepID=UPI001BDA632D|nr:EVE domain-containing protein [Alteromonas oceanisediminis]MBT0585827.1 EVE domain-containing protein [Alteromonas oceanisediminis]